VRRGNAGGPLAPPYSGPYRVLHRREKVFDIQMGQRVEAVSVDWLKPHRGEQKVLDSFGFGSAKLINLQQPCSKQKYRRPVAGSESYFQFKNSGTGRLFSQSENTCDLTTMKIICLF
jgi:hypothetical protein